MHSVKAQIRDVPWNMAWTLGHEQVDIEIWGRVAHEIIEPARFQIITLVYDQVYRLYDQVSDGDWNDL